MTFQILMKNIQPRKSTIFSHRLFSGSRGNHDNTKEKDLYSTGVLVASLDRHFRASSSPAMRMVDPVFAESQPKTQFSDIEIRSMEHDLFE